MDKWFLTSIFIIVFSIALNGCSNGSPVDKFSQSLNSLWNQACVLIGLCETKTGTLEKYASTLEKTIKSFEEKRKEAAKDIAKSAEGDVKDGTKYDSDLQALSRSTVQDKKSE